MEVLLLVKVKLKGDTEDKIAVLWLQVSAIEFNVLEAKFIKKLLDVDSVFEDEVNYISKWFLEEVDQAAD